MDSGALGWMVEMERVLNRTYLFETFKDNRDGKMDKIEQGGPSGKVN